MTRKDEYYNRAKQEGYRSRAAYKLRQLDDREALLAPGDAVVDLGAAPGGWLQVAAEAVGENGVVVGVDRQSIDPLEDVGTSVETVRGDMTETHTIDEIREHLPRGVADVVVSDMAPEMTGEYPVDQARSIHLAERALAAATALLAPGGHLVIKVFDGPDVASFRRRLEGQFEHVAATTPDASRDSSSERYLIGKRFVDPPVTVGETMTVEITDTGDEGDGIARVEGYTLFVPGAEPGETRTVEVDAVKQHYGFAKPVERSDEPDAP